MTIYNHLKVQSCSGVSGHTFIKWPFTFVFGLTSDFLHINSSLRNPSGNSNVCRVELIHAIKLSYGLRYWPKLFRPKIEFTLILD